MDITRLSATRFLVRYVKTYKIKSALIGGALLVLAGMGVQTLLQQAGGEPTLERTPRVSLLNVDEYRLENAVVESVGEVESLSQVELKSQVSERVKEVRVAIGQRVQRGQVLLVLDSVSLISQIEQAQANLGAEEARLEELRRGARSEELQLQEVRVRNATVALQEAEKTLVNAAKDAYTKAEDGIHNTIDILYTNPRTSTPQIIFPISETQVETDVEWGRFLVEEMLKKWKQDVDGLSVVGTGSVDAGFTKTNLEQTRNFLEKLAVAVNTVNPTFTLPQTTIDVWKASVSGVRTSINAAISSFTATEEKVQGAESALALTENELALQKAGTSQEQLAQQEARVRSLQAGLQNLISQGDQVAIPAPISGVVATLPVRVGELAQMGQTVASIVNPGSVQVKTYLSGEDARFVQQGARAVIEGEFEGAVTSVAPSLDPATKKVETLVGVEGRGNEDLVIGQFANVKIFIENGLQNADTFFLPLQSIKVEPEASFVYTLSGDNVVERHQVELGRVIGNSVEVISGIESGMTVVFSVRGLEPGDKVEIE